MRGLILILVWTVLALPAALVIFPWTLITRKTQVLLRVGFWIARAGLPFGGVRVVVHGLDRLPRGASIVMANHSSNLDPPVLIPLLPGRVVIYLKASLMRIPVLGYAMRLAGYIPGDAGWQRGEREGDERRGAERARAGKLPGAVSGRDAVAGWIAPPVQEGSILSREGFRRAGGAGFDCGRDANAAEGQFER